MYQQLGTSMDHVTMLILINNDTTDNIGITVIRMA